jgi:gramicidin S synthase 2/tyrocidine synthetase-3
MMNRNVSGEITYAASQYGKERDYWLNKLSGELVKSCFPYDFKEINENQYRRESVKFGFSQELFSKLMAISSQLVHRLYMILAAGLVILLKKYTGNDDILLGTPIYHQDIEGDFINTVLVLRNRINDGMSFREVLLKRVRETIIEANENQNYPIETLLFQLDMKNPRDQFYLFDAAILLENIHDKKYLRRTNPNIIFSFSKGDNYLAGELEYNSFLYRKETIERIISHFTVVLEKALSNIDIQVRHIDILCDEEKQQQLFAFNDTKTEYPRDKTIDELFVQQVARTPDKIALTYEGDPLTYRELNEKADRLASYLHSLSVECEEPVALMAGDSHVVIIALLGILKVGGAYLPLNLDYPWERKKYILKDCGAKKLLTNYNFQEALDPALTLVDLNDNGIYRYNHEDKNHFERERGSSNLAYIMYTSGSTGMPKGVMVEHGNVVRLVKNSNFIEFEKSDSIILTGALEFDASTFEIWGPLLNGLTLHLVGKDTILGHDRLKHALARSRVTTMWMTSSLFNQVSDADIEIFSGLKNLLVGGDVLSPAHINRVRNRFPGLNVINGYGPTENTTFSLTHWIAKAYQKSIPIGKPISNSFAYILDNHYNLVPLGVAGELYVGGDGLSRGYLNNQELSKEKFIPNPFASGLDSRNGEIYATGDFARWLWDGTIEFLGRMDHQVKIRGYRIEPGEIENHLMRIDYIKEAVVIDSIDGNGEKYLCAYMVPTEEKKDRFDAVELRKKLSQQLPDYMVPAYFVQLEEIPLTPNGKVDRRALPEPETIGTAAPYAAPRNPVEEKFVEIWWEVLKVEKEKIGIDTDFFELGGHSLKAMILISKLHKAFNVRIPLAELFSIPTIRELAQYIKGLTTYRFSSIKAAEEKEYYELSSAQKRLYVLQQMKLARTVYNIPQSVVLEGELDLYRLEKTFKKLIERHESLRTSFKMINEEPVQFIHHQVEFKIKYYDFYRTGIEVKVEEREGTGGLAPMLLELETRTINNFIRPFDLTKAPLLRVGLIHTPSLAGHRYILMVDMHHIITDGTSMDLFVKEFKVLYAGKELSDLRLQYKDYTQWQKEIRQSQEEAVKQQEGYWLKQFEGEIPVLNLPIDYPRPAVQSFTGSTLEFELPAHQTRALIDLALKTGTTLYMVLLAIDNILLSKISGQEDIVVGTPTAARRHVDLEKIIGMFVNTLAIRNYPQGEKTFKDFLKEVKESTLEAFENQEYQFEDLVEQVAVNRDASRNPLFDVMFALPNMEAQTRDIPTEIPGLKVKPYENENPISKFDINLACVEVGEVLSCSFEYCTKLFKRETIGRFIRYLKKIISTVSDKPDIELSRIEIVASEEKQQLLFDFNDTETAYPDKTIPRLFEQQVEKTPDHIAVSIKDKQLTYRELKRNTNGLAHRLRDRGIKPDNIVGIIVKPSLEMVVGIMAILKAGGAYLPIEPEYPGERIRFMLENSDSKILLTPGKYSQSVVWAGKMMDIQLGMNYTENDNLEHLSKPEDLLYLIYTSGSTGRPKGAMVKIKSFINLLDWYTGEFNIDARHNLLLMASLSFDLAQKNLFSPLIKGARLCLPFCGLNYYDELSDLIVKEQITMTNCTPSVFYPLVEFNLDSDFIKLKSLKKVFLGGESIQTDKLRPWTNSEACGCEIVNTYGPTECTDIASFYRINPEDINQRKNIPIGKPIHNVKLFVLDKNQLILPVGIAGELCIGGISLGKGYCNNEQLTGEKFNEVVHLPGKKVYRTGDLTRWLPDGNIELLGRIDHQVKIRGFRIELGEIENHLIDIPRIKDAVVICSQDDKGNKNLYAYVVPDEDEDVEVSELRNGLSEVLPDYMIPSYFARLDKIPLTSNGKVDRRALPKPEFKAREDYVAPANKIEKKLAEIWSEVLAIEKNIISINTNFFELGGHSLKATVLVLKIHKALNVKVPLTEVFKRPTIRGLYQYIKKTGKDQFAMITPVEKKEYYVLSSAQKRLYTLQQIWPENIGYNMTQVSVLEGELEKDRLEKTFCKLIERHECLRTSYKLIDQEPVQIIIELDDLVFEIEYFDAGRNEEKIIKEFVRPFDLSMVPLFRVGLVNVEEAKHIMIVDMHHIISDGVSHGILVHDFFSLYNGKRLPSLRLQYKDYAEWQNSEKQKEAIRKQEEYWLKQFKEEIPMSNLLTDYARPAIESFVGESISFQLEKELTSELKKMAKETNTTLYVILLALYNILFSKYTGQEDIIVGSGIAGRNHADLENIIGIFVNLLPMRNRPTENKTFNDFLEEVKRNALDAYQNQDYQFDELVKKLRPGRNRNKTPLFDIQFTFQNIKQQSFDTGDLKIEPYNYKVRIMPFELGLDAFETNGSITMRLGYLISLFKKSTAEYIAKHYIEILQQVVENRDITLKDIKISHPLFAVKSDLSKEDALDFGF